MVELLLLFSSRRVSDSERHKIIFLFTRKLIYDRAEIDKKAIGEKKIAPCPNNEKIVTQINNENSLKKE